MNRLLTLWAWIAAGIERARERIRPTQDPEPLAIEEGDLAERQDHGVPAAREDRAAAAQPGESSPEVAQPEESTPPQTATEQPQKASTDPPAQPENPPAQPETSPAHPEESRRELAAMLEGTGAGAREGPENRATPLRVDTATWQMKSHGREWQKWRELTATASSGRRGVEWVDVFGEVIELDLERGRPGSGVLVLQTGTTRIQIRRNRAEVQITSLASEVEGIESWANRWLPRFVWWLRGIDCTDDDRDEQLGKLRRAGLQTKRIEPCVDVLGWQIVVGDEQALVSRAHVWSYRHGDGEHLDGFGAGERHRTPASIAVYDKIAKLRSGRGPARTALIDRWRELGWVGELSAEGKILDDAEPVTRIEPRIWGDALQLEGLDATDPGAPLDSEVVKVLFVDSLSRHRLVDLTAGCARKRDCPERPEWELARAAGGSAEPVRLQRDVAAKQATAIRSHALRQLGRAGASVEELLEGHGDGSRALDALGELIRGPDWEADRARVRARHRDLIEQAKGEA